MRLPACQSRRRGSGKRQPGPQASPAPCTVTSRTKRQSGGQCHDSVCDILCLSSSHCSNREALAASWRRTAATAALQRARTHRRRRVRARGGRDNPQGPASGGATPAAAITHCAVSDTHRQAPLRPYFAHAGLASRAKQAPRQRDHGYVSLHASRGEREGERWKPACRAKKERKDKRKKKQEGHHQRRAPSLS